MDGGSLPMGVKPQLCKLVDEPADGSEWLHEIKYDGYRMHARLDGGKTQLLTRTGLDWTHKYPAIAAALSVLPPQQAYFDGELCGVRVDSRPSRSAGIPMPIAPKRPLTGHLKLRLFQRDCW